MLCEHLASSKAHDSSPHSSKHPELKPSESNGRGAQAGRHEQGGGHGHLAAPPLLLGLGVRGGEAVSALHRLLGWEFTGFHHLHLNQLVFLMCGGYKLIKLLAITGSWFVRAALVT